MNTSVIISNFSNIKLELDPNKVLFCLNNEGELVYERFKDIPDYEGMYQVSTFGRVKSLKRGPYVPKDMLLRQAFNSYRYLTVSLTRNGTAKTITTHALIAITFLGHKPCGYELVVDHKDNIRTNNFEWNIQLITHRENSSKDKKEGLSKYIGVTREKYSKKCKAMVQINGKSIHLGVFDTEEEASQYYQNALKAIENGTEINRNVRTKTSKYVGVSRMEETNRWRAYTVINGKQKHIGCFKDEYEAHLAYKEFNNGIVNF